MKQNWWNIKDSPFNVVKEEKFLTLKFGTEYKKLGQRYNDNKEKVKGQRKENSNMGGKISNDKERQTD